MFKLIRNVYRGKKYQKIGLLLKLKKLPKKSPNSRKIAQSGHLEKNLNTFRTDHNAYNT
jgi:hypothetical protein